MKVTVDSKKGLNTNLKVFVDKKTIEEKIGIRLIELSKTVNLKGFRPGKVPINVLQRQFGKAVYGEVLEKILKGETPKPGSYRGRVNNEPENNRKTLMDLKNA